MFSVKTMLLGIGLLLAGNLIQGIPSLMFFFMIGGLFFLLRGFFDNDKNGEDDESC